MVERWPALPFREWADTCDTLHLWTQMPGKVRLMLSPRLNHWWNVALYVNGRGLTTSLIPYYRGEFEIQFDFIDQALANPHLRRHAPVVSARAAVRGGFLREVHGGSPRTRYRGGDQHAAAGNTRRHSVRTGRSSPRLQRRVRPALLAVLLSAVPVFEEFRARFIGKCSPVHFFWGSFDLACTRFSGRLAPPRKGVISSEAYSHEVISAGFWPGNEALDALFYAYAVPQPPGLPEERVRPAQAAWSKDLGEFILPYADMRRTESPEAALTDFLESTYEAGARLAHWDRAALERQQAVKTA